MALSIAAILMAPLALSAQELRQIEYTVKRGDTCWAIAKKLYDDPWKYKEIMKGKDVCPDDISPGQKLLLPHPEVVAKANPAAKIAARRGDVDARAPEVTKWAPAKRGQDLWRAWRVNAGDRSSARVAFTRSGARLEMRENTLVVIYGPQSSKVQRTGGRAVLANGSLHARLGELAGEDIEVETPSAQAKIADGEAIFEVDAGETTIVSNHTSKKVRLKGRDKKKRKKKRRKKKRKEVVVAANMGSKVAPGKDPTPPRPLPPSPTFASKEVRTPFGAGGAPVTWEAVKGAVMYRVELLSGPSPDGELIDMIPVKAPTTSVAFESLERGTYYVRVSVRDAEGFEGRFGPDVKLLVEDRAPLAREAVAGTLFEGPAGARCGLAEGTPSARLLVPGVGRHLVRCHAADTGALTEYDLTVKAPEIANRASLEDVVVRSGEVTELEVSFERAVQEVSLEVPAGVREHGFGQRDGGKTWLFYLSRLPGAQLGGSQAKLRVAGSEVAAVGLRGLDIEGPLPWSIGVYGGGGAAWLGDDGVPELRLGVRVMAQTAPWLGLHAELEGGSSLGGVPNLAGRLGAEIFATFGPWQPFARLGMGAEFLSAPERTQHIFAAGGLGVRLELATGLDLRLDVVQELAVFEMAPRLPVRGMLGVNWRF